MTADASFSVLTANNIETRRVRAGGVIFREGEDADELFVIKSGYVRIQIGNRIVADLTTDTIFGEMALIDDEPRSATAVAITDVELVPVSERQFLFLVSQTPYFALKVMRVLAQRLRVTKDTWLRPLFHGTNFVVATRRCRSRWTCVRSRSKPGRATLRLARRSITLRGWCRCPSRSRRRRAPFEGGHGSMKPEGRHMVMGGG